MDSLPIKNEDKGESADIKSARPAPVNVLSASPSPSREQVRAVDVLSTRLVSESPLATPTLSFATPAMSASSLLLWDEEIMLLEEEQQFAHQEDDLRRFNQLPGPALGGTEEAQKILENLILESAGPAMEQFFREGELSVPESVKVDLGLEYREDFESAFTTDALSSTGSVLAPREDYMLPLGQFRVRYAFPPPNSFLPSPLLTPRPDKVDGLSSSELSNLVLGSRPVVDELVHPKQLFSMSVHHVDDDQKAIFSTLPGLVFVKAAVGNDSLKPGNGEYRLMQNNKNLTTHQTIDFIGLVEDEHYGECVLLRGLLLYQPPTPSFSRPLPREKVLSYTLKFFLDNKTQFSPDRQQKIMFRLSVESVATNTAPDYDRLMLTFAMAEDEQVFGLGEQFSFWSLRGERVPILSREQGIGRGLQPITYILNHIPPRDPSYSGGDPLTTYTAIPHYITSYSRSMSLFTPTLSVFDFREKKSATVEVVERDFIGVLYAAQRPLDLIASFTEYDPDQRDFQGSGRMDPLPDWICGRGGAIIGIQGGEQKVYNVLDALRKWNVPVAGVWLQDWVGTREQMLDVSFPLPFVIPGFPSRSPVFLNVRSTSPQKRLWWNWEYDRLLYPNWPQFVARLKQDYQVNVMSYINPFLSDVEGGGKPKNSYGVNYYREAAKLGFLVKRLRQSSNGSLELVDYVISSGPGVDAGMVDLSNPNAFDWYKDLIKTNLLGHGVLGWMADFGEYLPFDASLFGEGYRFGNASFFGKLNAENYHNWYPREWARLNREAISEYFHDRALAQEVVFFMRSSGRDSPRFARAFWNGDQMHTWDHLDGLESTIMGTLSQGLSGMALTHSDIGGYTTINVDPNVRIQIGDRITSVYLPVIERRVRFVRQNRELFYRWMETCVFSCTAMFRTHEGSVPEENLQVWSDPDVMRKFSFYTSMWQSLMQYRQLLTQEHGMYGYPIVRPTFLHYPFMKSAVDMDRLSFMLGPMLFIVPITTRGVRTLNEIVRDEPWTEDPDSEESQARQVQRRRIQLRRQAIITSEIDEEAWMELNDQPMTVKGKLVHWLRDSLARHLGNALNAFGRRFSGIMPSEQVHVVHKDGIPAAKDRGAGTIVAPVKPPRSKHGIVCLPPGRWRHVWTGKIFHSINGMVMTSASETIQCPVGQPGVFLRLIDRVEMEEILSSPKKMEDREYWLDELTGPTMRQDDPVERAWIKYTMMMDSLTQFLERIRHETI